MDQQATEQEMGTYLPFYESRMGAMKSIVKSMRTDFPVDDTLMFRLWVEGFKQGIKHGKNIEKMEKVTT